MKLIKLPEKYIIPAKGHANHAPSQTKDISDELVPYIKEFYSLITKKYGGSDGRIYATSCYRKKGIDSVDLTDANGHYLGRSIDFATDWTRNSFWPNSPDWTKEALRRIMWMAGFRFPWYKSGEFWHISVEIDPWKKNAYRDCPTPWNNRFVPDDWEKQLKGYNSSSTKQWINNTYFNKKGNNGGSNKR